MLLKCQILSKHIQKGRVSNTVSVSGNLNSPNVKVMITECQFLLQSIIQFYVFSTHSLDSTSHFNKFETSHQCTHCNVDHSRICSLLIQSYQSGVAGGSQKQEISFFLNKICHQSFSTETFFNYEYFN